MFFTASKVFWGLAAPSHVILWCCLLAAILLATGRRRAGTVFAVLTAVLLIGIGVVPSYIWLGRGLENRFDDVRLPPRADGILVLGGGAEDFKRLPVAYMLSRRYPGARLVFSGGSGALIDNTPYVEAEQARHFLVNLGLDPARLTLEGRSRNTAENLEFSKALVRPRPGDIWILVTSAYHMPRAMEIADRVGWTFAPWPSDRLTPRHGLRGWFSIVGNMGAFDGLVRERIGLVVYRLSGRASR